MARQKRKPTVKTIIAPHLRNGVAPQKKLIALHYHPDAIRTNVKDLKDMSEEPSIKNLFEDIEVLVNWALDRLPIAKPKERDESQEESIPKEGGSVSEEVQCKDNK